eukprot:gene29335-8890_t
MRDPRKGKPPPRGRGGKGKSPGGAKKKTGAGSMDTDGPSTSGVAHPTDEELDYDPTAYDCFHRLQLDWPSLSFDIVKDDLGGPRAAFPHTVFLVAGTQAESAKQNYVAFMKLAKLGQGRHGKKTKKTKEKEEESSSSDSEDGSSSNGDDEEEMMVDDNGGEEPPKMHLRKVPFAGSINRVRSCPQQPGIVAVWAETGQVKILDGSSILRDLAAEEDPAPKTKVDLKPLHSHSHSMEGYAMDWSPVKALRFASGDCSKKIHVWEPQEGGKWQVGGAFQGHEASVEDIQWSPTEETVFASCSVDKTIRVWDIREKSKPMITVQAHDTDVNVMSWNRSVTCMLASGADDGTICIWDLRSFAQGAYVSRFDFHKAPVTGIEWCPYEGSMLASSSADNQLAVWDLALERDPEEETALAPKENAVAPEDLPAQLLFVHAGQKDLKELHWHSQIPGLICTTAGDGFNVFKASNM